MKYDCRHPDPGIADKKNNASLGAGFSYTQGCDAWAEIVSEEPLA
jgi:hypothetical protein